MLKPVERQRVADDIAGQLRALILTGHYQVGDKLPPERELAKTLGVNRASLREALKTLEHQGLVRIRQGDGTRVEDFMKTAGLDLLGHLIPLIKTPDIVGDLLEFRMLCARQLARMAAERSQPEDLERLREVVERAADESLSPGELLAVDYDFYIVLGQAAKNRVMMLLINHLRDAVRDHGALLAMALGTPALVRHHHRKVLAAVERRDAEAADRAVQEYMEAGARHVMEFLRSGALA